MRLSRCAGRQAHGRLTGPQMASLKALREWFTANGISLNYELLQLELMSAARGCTAYNVQAITAVSEGDQLGVIPKAACLSIRTTDVAEIIQQERLGGGLGLIFAVMHESSLQAGSKWHGYLDSLPEREYLPLFWTEAELQRLQGTEAHQRALSDRELTIQDYETHVVSLLQKYRDKLKASKLTQASFNAAASWVASRAFGIDDYHDAFNHKIAKVKLTGHYAVEPVCYGEDSSQESSASQQAGDSERSSDSAGEAVQSCADSEAHSDRVNADDDEQPDADRPFKRPRITRGDLIGPNDAALRLEIGICSADRDGEEVLEVIAASDVPAGNEIHNTYGELGNADLVSKYGFALPGNPFDAIELDKRQLVEGAERAMTQRLSKRSFKRRLRFLQEDSDLLEEDEEPFEVIPGAKVGPCLYAALRILCAEEAAFSGWHSISDALKPAQAQQPATQIDISSRSEECLDGEEPDLGMVEIGSSEHAWTADMLQVLHDALTARLAGYHHKDVKDDEAELAAIPDESRTEAHLAARAALILCIGEKHLIGEACRSIASARNKMQLQS